MAGKWPCTPLWYNSGAQLWEWNWIHLDIEISRILQIKEETNACSSQENFPQRNHHYDDYNNVAFVGDVMTQCLLYYNMPNWHVYHKQQSNEWKHIYYITRLDRKFYSRQKSSISSSNAANLLISFPKKNNKAFFMVGKKSSCCTIPETQTSFRDTYRDFFFWMTSQHRQKYSSWLHRQNNNGHPYCTSPKQLYIQNYEYACAFII